MSRKRGAALLVYFFLSALSLLVLYPLFFAVISSLKSVDRYTLDKLGMPENVYWGNYAAVLFNMRLLVYLLNTIITVALAMVFYLIICSAAGLAFGKFKFRGRIALFSLILFFQIFPQMVVAGELYQLLSNMRLLNTHR
jgi:ABC-type glycerol-3-phosphate transport system permease component